MKSVYRSSRPCMEIGIAGLADGDYPFEFEVLPDDLDLAPDQFSQPLRVTGTLRRVSTQLTLEAVAETTRQRTCDRCLAEDEVSVNVPLRIYYREHVGHAADDDGAEMFRELDPKQESIVLDDDVRSLILVSLPLKNLCNDECRGLCPACGADLNTETCSCAPVVVDPRWEKLAGLFGAADEPV